MSSQDLYQVFSMSDNVDCSYQTISAGQLVEAEIVEKKSRFIAQLTHVETEAAADEFIAQVRAKHHDARHNVPAWILTSGKERTSDDGEPSRTAGMPVLDVLRGAHLKDVCCVVTRYFGGTLLGTGGLVRAYTTATQAVLAAAEADGRIATMSLIVPVVVQLPYTLYDRVSRLAAENGARTKDSLFTDDVQLTLHFLAGGEQAFIEEMTQLTAGEDLCSIGQSFFGEF